MNQEKVLIAMSGGVDSSAAALLLQKQGYACDGAMLRLYAGEQESGCCSESDAADARSVAYRLGMKFYVFNETERFAQQKANLEQIYGARVALLENPDVVEISSTELRVR